MLSNFPVLSRFLSKLVFELLPAAVASVVGGLLFSHYAKPSQTPPAVTIAAPSGDAKIVQMVQDEHTLLVDFLKRSSEVRQQADQAVEQEIKKLKAAERAALNAAREARAAESKALAIAARDTARHDSAAEPSASKLEKAPKKEALPVRPAAAESQPSAVATPPVGIVTVATAQSSDDNPVLAKLREAKSTVERIPHLFSGTTGWLSESPPPRPPAQVPEQNIPNAAM